MTSLKKEGIVKQTGLKSKGPLYTWYTDIYLVWY